MRGIYRITATLCAIGAISAAGPIEWVNLRTKVVTDRAKYAVNAPIKMTVSITNSDKKPFTLKSRSGERYEFSLTQARKRIWNWSQGRMFTQEMVEDALGAGKTRKFAETYTPGKTGMPKLPPGTYTLEGCIHVDGSLAQCGSASFKVVASK